MGVKYECREIGESDWRECTEDEYRRYSGYPEMDTRVVGRFSSNSVQPQNLPKIIGRFEPIGEEVGPRRAPFEVLTKEPYEFKGRQGFKGVTLAGALKGAYSVISDHWRWVPADSQGFEPINPRRFDCEHDFEGRAPDGGPISMQQPVVYVCRKCGEQEKE